MSTTPLPGTSFLSKLTTTVYLDYVLKALGIIFFAIAFFNAWKHVTFLEKTGFIVAPIMWFVGARFSKIYR